MLPDAADPEFIALFDAKAYAILSGRATPKIAAWVNRAVRDPLKLHEFIEHRRRQIVEDADTDDVREVLSIDPRGSANWATLVECGFERILFPKDQSPGPDVHKSLGAVLFNPDLLESLEEAVLSAPQASNAWLQITEGVQSIEPRLFVLPPGSSRTKPVQRIRIRSYPTAERDVPGIEMVFDGRHLTARLTGLHGYTGRWVDAVLATLNSGVFTAFPLPQGGRNGSGITRDAWTQWRKHEDRRRMELEGAPVVVDANGRCTLRLPVREAARPLSDKVLVVMIQNEPEPTRSASPRGSGRPRS